MGDLKQISLPYGAREVSCTLDAGRLQAYLSLRDVAPAPDPQTLLGEILDHPIGAPSLAEAVRGSGNVLILVDDITRPTPTWLILPPLLERLGRACIPDRQIRVLVALGTHRLMSPRELERKLGAEAISRCQILQHDHRDPSMLVHLGETAGGVPIVVNRWVVQSQFVIAVGNIVPHRYCGWSGGGKMIQPGVAGAAAIAATHMRAALNADVALGVVENSVRREMEEVADRAGLRFIVNTILTRKGEIYKAVAGDPKEAFRVGVRHALDVFSVPFDSRVDIVLAASYPCELNFWQAGKALYATDLMVNTGGTIILSCPCVEGLGEHPEFPHLVPVGVQGIIDRLNRGAVDDPIGVAAALLVAKVASRARIHVVSDGLSERTVETMGFRHFRTIQEALKEAFASHGGATRALVLREGGEALPVQRPSQGARQ
jgi:lactate racemase